MTTAKTLGELQNLIMTEMLDTCPECASITGVVTTPSDDPDGEGNWDLAAVIRDGTPASPNCKRAQETAVLRLRQQYHLISD
jgi:hypothetical protein